MSLPDATKAVLCRSLALHREVLVWKLDGLAEIDQRWPATTSGTNLLGLVKHAAFTEAGYFGDCFGRPLPDAPAWMVTEPDGPEEPDEANADMWARPEESPAEIVALYRRVIAHGDATIEALDLDAPGRRQQPAPGRRGVVGGVRREPACCRRSEWGSARTCLTRPDLFDPPAARPTGPPAGPPVAAAQRM